MSIIGLSYILTSTGAVAMDKTAGGAIAGATVGAGAGGMIGKAAR